MALTVIPLSGLANDVVDSISAGAGGGGPRIANVQIANSSWGLLDDTAVSTDGGYVLINGSGFASGCSVLVANSQATPVTFANSSLLRVQVPAKSASTYAVYVLNPDGGTAIGINALTYSAFPAWATSSTLSGGSVDAAISVQLSASDATTYTLQAGSSLPANTTLASNGLFSGTITGINEETTYTFTVEATDAENQNTPRTFSITISVGDSNFKSTTLLLNADANTFVRDASNNAFNITVNGDTKPSAFSPFNTNWSNYFDGTGDYLTAAQNAAFNLGTGAFTVEGFFYLTSFASANRIVGLGDGASGGSPLTYTGWTLSFTSTVIRWYRYDGTETNYSSNATINLNQWNHVAVSRDGSGNLAIFFNGVRILNQAGVTTAYNNVNANPLYIGRIDDGNPATPKYVTGYVSNVRIVKGTAAYDPTSSTLVVPTTPLTAITNTSLLTCQSNRLIDNSTNAFTITKNGDTKVTAFGPFTETDTTTGSGYFDGTGDFLDPTTSNSAFSFDTGNFTVEAWIYPNSLSNYMGIVGQAITSADTQHSFFVFANGQVTHQSYFAVGLATTTSNITTGMWHHVAAVRSGANGAIFINGVRAASNTAYTKNYSNTNPIRIGAAADAGSAVFNGYISNARVIKGTAVYDPTQSTITVPTTSLTAVTNTQLLTLQNRIGVTNHTFVDESGINHLFTRGGNASQGSFSPYVPTGWSGYFDGTTDYLTVADNAALTMGASSFTIEGWFYPLNYTGTDKVILIHRPVTTARGLALAFSQTTGTPYLLAGDTNNAAWEISLTGSTGATLNAWNHVAFTRNSSTWNIWLNGVSVASGTASFTVDDSSTLYLFAAADASAAFPGYISNFRIIKGNALYTTTFTPSINPLTPIANTSLLTLRGNGFTDDGPNRFAITRSGDVRVVPFSPFKSHAVTANTHSVYFDGTGDELETASAIVSSTEYSIEAWVYANADTQGYIAAQYTAGNGNRTVFLYRETTGVLYFYHPNQGSQAAGTLNLNTWYHVAITRDSNARTRIFVDGVLKATFTTAYTPEASSFSIGGNGEAGSNFNGYISNMRVFNGAIPADYQTASTTIDAQIFTPPTAPLTAVSGTSLLTCQSSTITDNSSNAFALTVSGNSQPTKFNPFGETITQVVEYSANTHGGSVYFDGTSDSLITTTTVPAIGTGDFTIDAWVYLLSAPSINGWIYGNRSGSATSGYLFISSSLVPVYGADAGSIDLTSSTAVKVATWNHIAVSRSGSTIRLFLNGILVASATNTNNYSYAGTQPVGYASSGSAYTLNGYISDLRVVIGTALYKSSFIPPSTTLSAVSGTVFLLNNDRGGIVDVSGRNVLECVGNARVSTDTKKYGTGSFYFDGTGDYLLPPPSQNFAFRTGDFTIELWIKTSSTADDGILQISTTAGGFATSYTNGLMMSIVSGTVYWALNGSSVNTSTSFNDGNWHHLAMTRSGSTVRVFKNGTQISTATNAGDVTGTNLVIGGYYSSTYTLDGYIDDLRITKGVARYTSNFTAPTSAHQTK